MKRLVLVLALLGVCAEARAADAVTPPAQSPQKVADHVIAVFKSHRVVALKKESPQDIAILEKGAKDFPADAHIFVALAYCYIIQDNKVAHLKNLEKAHALSPKDGPLSLSYAVALKMNQQPGKALEVMKLLAADYPKLAAVQYQLAVMEMAVQKYDDAIAIMEPILQDTAAPLGELDKAVYLSSLADCYLYKGDWTKAIDLGNQAVALAPQLGAAYTVLGEAYLKNGDVENAGAALDKILALDANSPEALYYKGLVLEKQGKADLAKISFQGAYTNLKPRVGADGQNGEDYFLMYLVCQKLSKADEAAQNKAEAGRLLYSYEAPWKK